MTTHDLTDSSVTIPGDSSEEDVRHTSRTYEAVIGVVVALVGGALFVAARDIDLAREGQAFGPRWWPTALAISMVIAGLVLVVQAFTGRIVSDEAAMTRSGGVALTATLLVIVVYGTAWQYLDFRVVTVVLLAALVAIFGGRGIKALLVFPVVTTAVLWVIFGMLLQVPL
ncbi:MULTISPECIES: tripartite tricarboxylate transporter TctB family protein [unclassified Rhodococcus (in: high G+C Gram-positive bacteria)]|uniref:tripartite tricarboxylate transporter TctB family protein n=1 Tax=unclassified Rhodococcus (in: high G+C Gram-positive bacteria) TaxID=192944 RepID=UPI0006F71337|nr:MULTISPECIES: tripartite tricarboxylate transporter TctB family protein [unclassified Rhodococcus (in: high G+C Gram-positive bacteria)]KQU36441.1 hypothetical protein ASG69_19605 [Rhodococcus sp. Leaf225]KQU48987.1 hypothetical protein ASH03_04070 [Rhodococcus sp. Leaf258]MBY6682723.1 tripartite tricarboxylate transporter TctB family protein [Rhodococcus sp. BP-316]